MAGEWASDGFKRAVVAEMGAPAKRGVRDDPTAEGTLTIRPSFATKRSMSVLPSCPHLPAARPGLDWRTLHAFRDSDRGPEFYLACLEYGQALWQRGLAARAMLCLDRALGADLQGTEAALQDWPLPYAAMRWVVEQVPPGVFVGNPRVHFQHYADRMNEPRREQRRWRAWACWALVRVARPEFPADPRHEVTEPTHNEIAAALDTHGHVGEKMLWQAVLATGNSAT